MFNLSYKNRKHDGKAKDGGRLSVERNLHEIRAHEVACGLAHKGWWNRKIAEGPPAPVRTYTPEEFAALDLPQHHTRALRSTLWREWVHDWEQDLAEARGPERA